MAPQKDPFRSARLIYRAVRGAEDDAVFAAINDDPIGYMNSNAGNNHLPGPSDAERFRKSMDDNLLSAIICLPEDLPAPPPPPGSSSTPETTTTTANSNPNPRAGTPIGQIHLSNLSPRMRHHRNTEIGIDILPAYQGRGYGSEAIRWVLDYAFHRAGLHKVRIRAFEWNEGACRLYQRLGFVEEGRERESLWHEGRWWDGVEFGMVEGEWRALVEEEKKKKGEEKEVVV
ncbi:hypothetical protein DPSP01_007514 [Paraphaeosphaeria sporulosa]|uniref:Acyl-CoA N-acyltransferase n=1 Tax=Paraphaeosphaeria sporulosa TaxID=1460663 RepID=A0A177CXQ9_9PLEO|nr:acyl-CoA N-acyltransferase [Paraphaeosphaeria sporulosa]OAG11617.1 acyl-CoA N-acyltransferase [Paraphaeosphaeria sporulosa]